MTGFSAEENDNRREKKKREKKERVKRAGSPSISSKIASSNRFYSLIAIRGAKRCACAFLSDLGKADELHALV